MDASFQLIKKLSIIEENQIYKRKEKGLLNTFNWSQNILPENLAQFGLGSCSAVPEGFL